MTASEESLFEDRYVSPCSMAPAGAADAVPKGDAVPSGDAGIYFLSLYDPRCANE